MGVCYAGPLLLDELADMYEVLVVNNADHLTKN